MADLVANISRHGRYARLVALAIANPDEIWVNEEWVKRDGEMQPVMKRRYVKVWQEEDGRTLATLAVFEWDEVLWWKTEGIGWKLVTGFPVLRDDWMRYLNSRVRIGKIVYGRALE